jgi:Cdc6-like AAA superfamily ATPase
MYALRGYDSKLFTIIKCKQTKGIKEVLAAIAGLKPLARQRAPELMPEVIKALKKDKRIIVIDDVTAVASWPELLGYLDGIFREVQAPIIVTTNVFKFLDRLPEDVRHTLLFFRVDFPAYNAVDLYQIIKDRVGLSGAKFPEESLHIIAAGAAQVGSARDALTMTRTAIQQSRTDLKAIQELQHIMEEQTYLDYVSKLAPKERQVLGYIIQRYAKSRKGIPVRDITRDLRLSPSRTSQLVTGLEQYEVIQTRTEHEGGGNYRVIELDETLAEKAARGEIDVSQF